MNLHAPAFLVIPEAMALKIIVLSPCTKLSCHPRMWCGYFESHTNELEVSRTRLRRMAEGIPCVLVYGVVQSWYHHNLS